MKEDSAAKGKLELLNIVKSISYAYFQPQIHCTVVRKSQS